MDNLQPVTYAIISIAFAIGIASFLGRWYSRLLVVRSFGADDMFSIVLFVRLDLFQSASGAALRRISTNARASS
jgi:hypothetical protein